MAFEDSDRRRTTVLLILTIIALPIIFFVTRGDDADGDAGVVDPSTGEPIPVDADPMAASDNGPSRPPLAASDAEPTFLDGPAADPSPGVAEVAVPARPDTAPVRLDASYRSTVAGQEACLVKDLDSGLSVTVTNLDNGRSVTCVTSIAPFSQTADIVLHTDAFSLLADLTEAPITVELTQ
ncbi:MAG: hypothetical protein WA964_04890 [Ilumatobacter sp.]|uniref:hypothetical protein n=1 Tax=Ilumatobacter sp. TaxID=1967498 RepID=UPI003C786331